MTYSKLMALAEQLRQCATQSCLDCDKVMDDSLCLVKNLDGIADVIEALAELVAEADTSILQ